MSERITKRGVTACSRRRSPFLWLWAVGILTVSPRLPAGTIFYEDWSSGQGLWDIENGVWELAGEEGARYFVTVAGGNYPYHTDSRLISPPVRLPTVTADEEIQLRLLHWFRYSDGHDYGRVEVSVWNAPETSWGPWTPIGSNTLDSRVWSRRIYDLTAFAGERIKIAFFHVANGSYNYPGWYLQEVEILQLVPRLTYDFKKGLVDWSVESGVWEIGGSEDDVWIATVADGNYPYHTDSRLISAPFVLMSVSDKEEIQLRLAHWFDYADGHDTGYVQISVWDADAAQWGSWMSLGSNTLRSSVWSRRTYDLTPFAGSRVRLCFYHTSNGSYLYSGWYIRGLEIVRKVPCLTFDFANGLVDWSVEAGVWEIGESSVPPGGCPDGGKCAGTVLAGNYPYHTDSRLISAPFRIPPFNGNDDILLRFLHWFNYGDGRDTGYVQISLWDEETSGWLGWQNLASFTLNSSVWSLKSVDLTPFAGQRARLAFLHTSNGSYLYKGWYIANIEITGVDPCGTIQDCNENDVDDTTDIANGTSQDEDGDGIPDECGDSSLLFRVDVLEPPATPGETSEGITAWKAGVPTGGDRVSVTVGVYLESDLGDGTGAQAWSIPLLTGDCFNITEATTAGTAGAHVDDDPRGRRTDGFEKTEVINPGLEHNGGRQGVVSAVVLSFSTPSMLPPEGEELILKVRGELDTTLVGAHGDETEPCVVRPLSAPPWLLGSGQPVESLVTVDESGERPAVHGASITLAGVQTFVRGDVNADGVINISDAIKLLGYLFLGTQGPACLDAADTNDQGQLNVTSVVYVLSWLFLDGSVPPPPPSPSAPDYSVGDCGSDPTVDSLACGAFPPCSR